jgi:hypothetical protein
MNLDVYRGCSFKEKRDVLNAFWRSGVDTTPRITEAAVQYGYYTLICLGVIVAELALILAVAISHGSFVEWLSALGELFVLWSTWWAVKRYRTLKTQVATGVAL